MMPISDEIWSMVLDNCSANEIRKIAVKQGMKGLREDGWRLILDGRTTLEEVLRVRKREARLERLRRLGKDVDVNSLDPLAPKPVDPQSPPLPTDFRRFQDAGATAQYRPRAVDESAEVKRQPRRIRWDWLRDKSLLVIELGLVTGLIFVLFSLQMTVREVNEESN